MKQLGLPECNQQFVGDHFGGDTKGVQLGQTRQGLESTRCDLRFAQIENAQVRKLGEVCKPGIGQLIS